MGFEKKKWPSSLFSNSGSLVPWLLVIGISLLFVVMLYPTLATKTHTYQLGDVAESDIKAPLDFFIEDPQATAEKRRQEVEKVLTVYDHDVMLAVHLTQRIQQAFARCRAVFEADREVLWIEPSGTGETDLSEISRDKEPVHLQIQKLKDEFQEILGINISDGAYALLEKHAFSTEIEQRIIRILAEILKNGVVANKELLLRESEKGIALRNIHSNNERVIRNLKQFYGLDQSLTMVRIVGQPMLRDLDYNLRNLIVDFAQQLIQPNITQNRNATESRKKRAAAEIKPIMYKIKAGEMLLREGERVTKVQLMKLDALQEKSREEKRLISGIGAALILLFLMVSIHMLHLNPHVHFKNKRNKNLLFLSSVLVIFFFFARLSPPLAAAMTENAPLSLTAKSLYFGLPIASAAMMFCLFMGLEIALAMAVVLAAGAAIILKNSFDLFLFFFLNGTMAAYWLQSCRERSVFFKAGLKVGLLNVLLVTAINAHTADYAGAKMLWDWAFAFLGGIGAGILTAGMAPLVEIVFDFTTDIKLLELANLDRPILRRLMLEAPGTYHHSVIVGSLGEAAATEIGANPLLAKVCGYYHDIGKVNKPLYFIENQAGGQNRHDRLAPNMSKRILIAHVKDGVEMAQKNRLGQIIVDTIRQSHGTSLISFFYEKAKKLRGEDAVKEEEFRYPGPKPQTREAGLVMLADMVEAASRTLENPTSARIQRLVQNLINKAFSDGQLDECELTLKDLHKIAKSFNKILSGIHHHRIEYPESAGKGNGKDRNGRFDRQPARHSQDLTGSHQTGGPNRLKRLGLS